MTYALPHPLASLGLRDSKALAKALHRVLQASPPTSQDATRRLLHSLPWPPALASETPLSSPPVWLLPEATDPRHEPLATVEPNHPCSFVTLGQLASPTQADLFPQGPDLHWTHRGALEGALVFGPDPERQAVLETLVLQAALAGRSVLWVTQAEDSRAVDRLALALAEHGQGHRLRSLNFLPGAPTHTFNPLAQPGIQRNVECLVHVFSGQPPLNMPMSDWTRFLLTFFNAALLATHHLSSEQQLVPDVDFLLDTARWSNLVALSRRTDIPEVLTAHLKAFLSLSKGLPGGGYDVVLAWLREEALGPLFKAFGHVLKAQRNYEGWRLPDVTTQDIAHGNLVTVVTVPPNATLLTRWILTDVTTVLYGRTRGERLPFGVRQLVVLDSVGSYGSPVVLDRLQRFLPAIGVATVVADRDYPSIQRMGPEASAMVGQCHTKIFTPGTSALEDLPSRLTKDLYPESSATLSQPSLPNATHVIEGSRLHRLKPCVSTFPEHASTYVPQSFGRTLGGPAVQHDAFLDRAAHLLWQRLCDHHRREPVSLAWCQETLARFLGKAHWHELTKRTRQKKL